MSKLLAYNEAFLQALAQLNDAQRQAVEKLEGPVLVVAGPGTGKTQILAARIGKILLETDADAHSILCLTYTDAGAIAMRKRLFQFIGPDAYRVHIYTFHAFCNDIIQHNLDYFGKYSLEPISDLERIELYQKLVDSFPKNHLLKRFRGDVYYEIPRLQQLFSVMKREGWTADFIAAKIDEYLHEIEYCEADSPYYKTFRYSKKRKDKQVGDFKPAFEEEQEKMEKLRVAAQEFANYEQLMLARNRYDYDDMIGWVLKAFKEDAGFLLNYQERYQYVLVDEFQDTSGTQNELISLLTNYWDTPNIFVVGDDDQSIFRFQGANVENILDFAQTYAQDLYKVVLTDNYRSSQAILDTAKHLIDHNTERLVGKIAGLTKNLVAKNDTFAQLNILPKISEFATQHHEFAAITNEVEALIASGVPANEIAIIYKEHKTGEALAHYFQLRGIAINTRRKADILQLPFANKLFTILRYLAQETDIPFSGDALLFEIMHFDFFDISPIAIAKITKAVSDNRKEHTSIRAYLNKNYLQKQPDLFANPEHTAIKQLALDMEFWIKTSKNVTLQQLFEKIIVRGGVLRYIMQSPEKMWLMQVLTSIFDFLKDESHKNPTINLANFVTTIDLLAKNDLKLELQQSLHNEQGVNFVTAHGSKGLEYAHVFLMGCTKNVWEGKRKPAGNYKLPDTVFSAQSTANDEEELRRLFYVALTRAKSHLRLSYSINSTAGKPLEASIFIGELITNSELRITQESIDEAALFEYLTLQFIEETQPQITLIDAQFIEHHLQGFELSVTALSNYLDCPLKFYFQNLIRVPSGKSETMEFGIAIHYALNQLFVKMQANETRNFPTKEVLVEDFKTHMFRRREGFTKEEFKRRMEYGEKILPEYYDYGVGQWNKIVLTEKHIGHVHVAGVPIRGALDKLEFDGKKVNVVDYKTGKYENAKTKLERPSEKNPNGGDYWRQAVFYKLLLDNDKTNDWQAVSAEFDFVEPVKNEYKTEQIQITLEDLQVVTEQIKNTYQKINNHEFSIGCGKNECKWCIFVKENYHTSISPIMEEE